MRLAGHVELLLKYYIYISVYPYTMGFASRTHTRHDIQYGKNTKYRFQKADLDKHLPWKWRQLMTERLVLTDPSTGTIGTTCN
jgi:hypothetical protein